MLSKAVVVAAYQRKLEELARLPGVELVVFSPPAWRDSRGETGLESTYTAGYDLVTTPIALNGHFHTHFYPRLGQALAAAQPDLIHVDEEPYNLATWQALRWAARHGRPALFFTWQNLLRRYPPPFDWIERYNYRHSAHAIAGNQEARQVLLAKGYRNPVTIIPQFGIDPQLFDRAAQPPLVPPSPQHRLTVGYAGGLVPEKGIDTLLHALAICQQPAGKAEGLPCRLLLAGGGPQQADLGRLVAQLGLGQHVVFLGRVGSTSMPAFFASIDVLAVPSRTTPTWKEQFGRVLVEAMACQTPVIGSDSGEIPHVIGEAGLIFAEGDAQILASHVLRLANDPALRAELARRGRERVLAHFTQEHIAAATYQVYQQILERP
ncbi:MAG TPA: glycosyltransferase [Anaerolineae bacterium]|nr:glycosyltransferase [Anaerolineae bacterium]